MRLSPFPTFPTFLTFGFGSCRLAEVRDHEDGRPGYPLVAGQRAAFFRGTYARKVRKVVPHDAEHLCDLSDLSDTEAAVAGHLEEIPGRASGAPRKPWAADRDPAEEKASR
jgi:hypothetical protein